MKGFFRLTSSVLAITVLSGGALALDLVKRQDLVLPRTLFANVTIGSMTRDEVRVVLKEKLTQFLEKPFQIGVRGKVAEVTLKELGVVFNEAVLLDAVPFASGFSAPEIFLYSIAGQRVTPDVSIERTELLRVLNEKFPDIPKIQNAHFVREGKTRVVVEASAGLAPDLEPFIESLKKSLLFLEHQPLVIEFNEAAPTVFAADIEAHREALNASLPKTLVFVNEKQKFSADFEKNPNWFAFDKKPYVVAAGELPLSVTFDPLPFSQFVHEAMDPKLEQAPEDVRISRNAEGKIEFEGRGNEGRIIPKERLLTLANQAISSRVGEVEVPLEVVPPKVEVSADLQRLGIRELVAVGHTKFAGSPANRQHNIGVGISKYGGLLIPPGETFSFNKNLGVVDDTTGYRKELVIKPEGTIPEFGGGLCQVSTTLYRAAMNAGFPITDRAPHSYAVTYYSQIGGHGLDATIYPPSRDLKFTNDTAGHILIQSYVDGVDAYFKFYGTKDDRKVVLEGPYITNKRSAPAQAVEVADPNLKPGEKKQVEKPHGGFDALWYRYITKGGVEVKEEIFSRYKAVPAKFLVGGEVVAENQGLSEATNPFE